MRKILSCEFNLDTACVELRLDDGILISIDCTAGKIIMANVSSSNGLEKRPKLRFPGFDEPWRAERLSDFADRVTRKNSKNETDLPLTISSKDGLVDQVSYFNKTVASKDMSGYYLLKNGEFAYNKSYSVGYDFGSIKRLDRYPMGALSNR